MKLRELLDVMCIGQIITITNCEVKILFKGLKRNCTNEQILKMTVQRVFSSESNEIIIQTKEV